MSELQILNMEQIDNVDEMLKSWQKNGVPVTAALLLYQVPKLIATVRAKDREIVELRQEDDDWQKQHDCVREKYERLKTAYNDAVTVIQVVYGITAPLCAACQEKDEIVRDFLVKHKEGAE